MLNIEGKSKLYLSTSLLLFFRSVKLYSVSLSFFDSNTFDVLRAVSIMSLEVMLLSLKREDGLFSLVMEDERSKDLDSNFFGGNNQLARRLNRSTVSWEDREGKPGFELGFHLCLFVFFGGVGVGVGMGMGDSRRLGEKVFCFGGLGAALWHCFD